MDISDEVLRRRKHIRDAHGRVQQLPIDGIIPDGWSVVVPLGLKDGALTDAETWSIEDCLERLPRDVERKLIRNKVEVRSDDPVRARQGVNNLDSLHRQVLRFADGDVQGYPDLDPQVAKIAGGNVASYIAGVADYGRMHVAELF